MRLLSLIKFLALGGFLTFSLFAQALELTEIRGEVVFVYETSEKKVSKLDRGVLPRSVLQIKTGQKSQARLDIGELGLILQENSELSLRGVVEVASSASVGNNFLLNRGLLRIENKAIRATVSTATSTAQVMGGVSLLLSSPKASGLTVLRGVAQFQGMNQEESLNLAALEQAVFEPRLEDGQPVFDTLLKGRRVARGTLTKQTPITETESKDLDRSTELNAPPKKKLVVVEKKSLCRNPAGDFNQCSWSCVGADSISQRKASGEPSPESSAVSSAGSAGSRVCPVDFGARCVRRRCVASGQWRDEQVLSRGQNQCFVRPRVRVGVCDY